MWHDQERGICRKVACLHVSRVASRRRRRCEKPISTSELGRAPGLHDPRGPRCPRGRRCAFFFLFATVAEVAVCLYSFPKRARGGVPIVSGFLARAPWGRMNGRNAGRAGSGRRVWKVECRGARSAAVVQVRRPAARTAWKLAAVDGRNACRAGSGRRGWQVECRGARSATVLQAGERR